MMATCIGNSSNKAAVQNDGLRGIAEQLLIKTDQQLDEAVEDGALQEICHDQKNKTKETLNKSVRP